MRILIHGTAEGSNYADRIASALATTALTRYGKKVLVLQLNEKHPIEETLVGRAKQATLIKGEFSFTDSGMDALWKRVRAGGITPEEWSDCTKNISKQDHGFDVAEISQNKNFHSMILTQFEFFEKMVLSGEEVYQIVFICVDHDDDEMIKTLKEARILNTPFIDKEIVCVPQGPAEVTVSPDTYLAVKNFDFNSEFSVKNMENYYHNKHIYPIPYNIGYKDACLKQDALRFLSLNVKPEDSDDNIEFAECVSKFVGVLLGVEEIEDKQKMFVFKR